MKKTLKIILFTLLGLVITSCTFPSAAATRTVVIETSTAIQLATPTQTATATPIQSLTPQPTVPTFSFVVVGTFTPTPIPTSVTVTVDNTSKGDYLNIFRSTDNLKYRVGPLAHGAYAIGLNDNFLVYCTNTGDVYAAKFGDEYLTLIGKLKKFSAFHRDVPPSFQLEIFINNDNYKVNVHENRFGESEVFLIPRHLTE